MSLATPTAVHGVLFDLDGTLLHTSLDIAAAAAAALADCGLPALDAATVERCVGRGIEVLIERCLEHLGRAPRGADFAPLHAAFLHHYARENGRHATPYPGVREGLAALRAAGLRLGVCTNKSAAFTLPLLERSALAGFFDLAVSGDTTARRKPAPDMIEFAARAWNLDCSALLMIGDSANDSAAARAAGCRVWLVPYGYNEGMPVQGLDCDGIVTGLDEAARRLIEPGPTW